MFRTEFIRNPKGLWVAVSSLCRLFEYWHFFKARPLLRPTSMTRTVRVTIAASDIVVKRANVDRRWAASVGKWTKVRGCRFSICINGFLQPRKPATTGSIRQLRVDLRVWHLMLLLLGRKTAQRFSCWELVEQM